MTWAAFYHYALLLLSFVAGVALVFIGFDEQRTALKVLGGLLLAAVLFVGGAGQ